jgi:hypothetical protein
MLGKNGIKVSDHIFPHKFTLKFLGDHSLTPCINFPGYIPKLTSFKDNLKMYNKLMFFKTLPNRTGKMLFNIHALSVFRYSASFVSLG